MDKFKPEIIANKTILENKRTNTVFLATKATEHTQLSHKNHSHIQWVGELDIDAPDVREEVKELFTELNLKNYLDIENQINNFLERKGF